MVNTFGQDIIIKNDKTEIKAKIEELTETTIKYKKFDMLDGPIYNINKRDVFMVIYKNGTKEYMETGQQKAITEPIASPMAEIPNKTSSEENTKDVKKDANSFEIPSHEKFTVKNNIYFYKGEQIKSTKQLLKILSENGSYEVVEKVGSAKVYLAMGYALGMVGGLGLISTVPGYITGKGGSPGLLLGSAVMLAGGYYCIKLYGKDSNKATKQFNQEGYEPKVSFKPSFKSDQLGNHIGISIGF